MNTYHTPLRCHDCSAPIFKKPGSKTPKYCPSCRNLRQLQWKNSAIAKRKRARAL